MTQTISKETEIAIMVANSQGRFYRKDAKEYMSIGEYRDWLIKHKADGYQVIRDGCTATMTKARKDHRCKVCPMPIVRGTHYYSVTYNGAGLGSIKFPNRLHIECINKYWERIGQ
jgi:hypothetical protein